MQLAIRNKSLPEHDPKGLRIDDKRLAQHAMIIGDTGVGKSALIRQFLLYARACGDAMIVLDSQTEFVKEFANAQSYVLNPKDNRCPILNIFKECRDIAEARTVAESAFPGAVHDNSSSGEFFHGHCTAIFSHLLAYGKKTIKWHIDKETGKPIIDLHEGQSETEDMAYWLTNPEQEIEPRLFYTEHVHTLNKNAAPQYAGIMGTLNKVGMTLRTMPPSTDQGRRRICLREWCKNPDGDIFFTSSPNIVKAIRPFQSMCFDLLINGLLSNKNPKRRVWIVLDELDSLETLTNLPLAITTIRKFGHPIIIGLQNREQIENRYPKKAKTIFSQAVSKFLLRTSDEESAKGMAGLIGDVEVVRWKETINSGSSGTKRSKSMSPEIVREPVVMPSQIQELPDFNFFFVQCGKVVKATIPYIAIPQVAPGLIERIITEHRPAPPSTPPPAPAPPVETKEPDIEPSHSSERMALMNNAKPEPRDPYVTTMTRYVKDASDQIKLAGLSPEKDFEGPPVTKFICKDCQTIQTFPDVLETPVGFCLTCGGEFYSANGRFVRHVNPLPFPKRNRNGDSQSIPGFGIKSPGPSQAMGRGADA